MNMESSSFRFPTDDFLVPQDTSQTPNKPTRYTSAPSQYQYNTQIQTHHQQPLNQFPETQTFLPSQPVLQTGISLQYRLQLEAMSQPMVPLQGMVFLPSNHGSIHQRNITTYPQTSLLQMPLVNNSANDTIVTTGVELSSTTISPFTGPSTSLGTAEQHCELQSPSNGSSPSTHAAVSQDFDPESAYVSLYATSNFEPSAGGGFGYASNAEQLINASVCLPHYVNSTMVYSATDTNNYLDNSQLIQASVLDDDSSASTAQPIGTVTPVHISDGQSDTRFCSPTDVSVRASPTPVISPGGGSQEPKRKQPRQDDGHYVAKRRKTKSQIGTNMEWETLETTKEHRGEPTLSSEVVFRCPSCTFQPFASLKELKNHEKNEHGRYGCILSFASGSTCDQRFSKKNEWKRHFMTQHVVPYYYVCTVPDCQEKKPRDKAANFLREDLFKAHLYRCHTPEHVKTEHRKRQTQDKTRRENLARSRVKTRRKSAAAHKNADDDDGESLTGIPFPKISCSLDYKYSCQERQELTKNALQPRVKLPSSIRCDFQGCGTVFEGEAALNKYLEHVAKYLDGLTPSADKFQFGLTLIPYFTGIGILKVKEGTSGDKLEWERITEAKDMVVSPEYVPDYKPDAY